MRVIRNTYCIYSYEDMANKHVYVGLTNRKFHRRDIEHRKGKIKKGVRKFDSVYNYFSNLGIDIPLGKVKMTDLSPEDAQYYEGWYAEQYINCGWKLINKGKTGSLGAASYKWTRETCYNEAKKYTYKGDFTKYSGRAYCVALSNGWLKDYTWLKERKKKDGYWNDYDVCYKVAKECKSRSEFERKYGTAYRWALDNGWLDDYTWFSPVIKWNKEACRDEAKKYKSRYAFKINCRGAFASSRSNGWLDEFFPKKVAA